MESSRPPSPRRARTFCLAAALLTLFAAWSWHVARTHSATFDEPGFIIAGVSYVTPGAPEISTTNLRLAQLWLAAPLRPLGPKLPDILDKLPSPVIGADSDLGRIFLADARNDGSALLRSSRAANIALGVVLGAVLFAWSRRWHGDGAGLLTLACFCLNPVVVSNSSLATTDVAATLAFVVATGTTWRLLNGATVWTVLVAGGAIGALLATKLSGLLIAPIVASMLAVRVTRPGPFAAARLWLTLASALLATGVVAWITLWGIYGFRFAAGTAMTPAAWSATPNDGSWLGVCADWLHTHRLLPESWLIDLRAFASSSGYRRTFLLGDHSLDGWWYFFPVVWFFKTPLAVHFALAAAAVTAWFAWSKNRPRANAALYALTPLLALGVIYGGATMAGRLNIGIRHWLPVLPLMFVTAGLAARLPSPRIRTGLIVALVAWAAFDAWRVREHPLAFVNALGGGTTHGYRTVVDSSFEWGGDLPGLERWLAARNARPGEKPPVYFSYFGNADLKRWKIDAVLLPQFFDLRETAGYALGPGTYVLSATMLQGVYGEVNGPWRPSLEHDYRQLTATMNQLAAANTSPESLNRFLAQDGVEVWQQRLRTYDWLRFARLCAWLRQREPADRVTPGLLVFELTVSDLVAALQGPPAELRPENVIKGTRDIPQERLDFRK